MRSAFRREVARYYDLAPHHPDDVPFYLEQIQSPDARVLELGCGTGRVSVPLREHCAYLCGIDHSEAMLEILRSKIPGVPESELRLKQGDISDFDLAESFDLIIAPFRVIQNLETEDQMTGLLRCVRKHLSPSGRCILNAFRPNADRHALLTGWTSEEEELSWEVETEDGVVSCHDHRVRVEDDPLVLYPELIYRRSVKGRVVDEAVLRIAMRCFYPEEFVERIVDAGFRVTNRWGGYAGETYGVGSELVVEFTLTT